MNDLDTVYAERIASEYTPKSTTKLVALKKLDRKAKLPATIFVYIFGIVSALTLGVGMCLCMGVIGIGVPVAMPLGIGVGMAGMVMAGVNYPIYKKMLVKGKQKYAFEIMELAREITAEQG